MKQLVFVIFLFFVTACGERNPENKIYEAISTEDSIAEAAQYTPVDVDSATIASMPWLDSLVNEYCTKSKNEVICATKKSYPISWLYDRMYQTDSTYYLVLHLGHDMEDHFATDGWIYIDTLTRSIYNYDVAADSIYKWKPL